MVKSGPETAQPGTQAPQPPPRTHKPSTVARAQPSVQETVRLSGQSALPSEKSGNQDATTKDELTAQQTEKPSGKGDSKLPPSEKPLNDAIVAGTKYKPDVSEKSGQKSGGSTGEEQESTTNILAEEAIAVIPQAKPAFSCVSISTTDGNTAEEATKIYSNAAWSEPIEALRNDKAQLPDTDTKDQRRIQTGTSHPVSVDMSSCVLGVTPDATARPKSTDTLDSSLSGQFRNEGRTQDSDFQSQRQAVCDSSKLVPDLGSEKSLSKGADGSAVLADVKKENRSEIQTGAKDAVRDSKQESKQSEVVDKHTVNNAERSDMQQEAGLCSNQTTGATTPDNDTSSSVSVTPDLSLGSKPKIFDEMISVKDVIVCSSSESSSCTSLEMDEVIESDEENGEAAPSCGVSSLVKPAAESVHVSAAAETDRALGESVKAGPGLSGLVPKIRVYVEQASGASPPVSPDQQTEVFTEEEVTFTIDIPADSPRPLPEVNEYVSATCIAVTSTSGTVNTTSQPRGQRHVTTSVSNSGKQVSVADSCAVTKAAMDAMDHPPPPPEGSTVTTAAIAMDVMDPHPAPTPDGTAVNICFDGAPSPPPSSGVAVAAAAAGGPTPVKHAGQEAAESRPDDPRTGNKAQETTHPDSTTDSRSIDGIAEAARANDSVNEVENNTEAQTAETLSTGDCTSDNRSLSTMAEKLDLNQVHVLAHMEPIFPDSSANVPFGTAAGQNARKSGGKHLDKHSPSCEAVEGNTHVTAAVDLSSETEAPAAYSAVIASRLSSGCEPGLDPPSLTFTASSSRDSAAINTQPRIAITAETAATSAENNTPAECGFPARDYLTVDDHQNLRARSVESDCSSVGRLIHSSDAEHSDINLDDIVVRNMEECTGNLDRRRMSESSGHDSDESDEVSSVRDSDTDLSEEEEEENNQDLKARLKKSLPDTVNDSDVDSCDKLKEDAKCKIEDVKDLKLNSDEESEESEVDEKKKCDVEDEDEKHKAACAEAKETEDCYAAKLENTGHKVGEPYIVVRRRKRAKMVDRETITTSVHEVQCPEVHEVSTDTFDSVLISSSGSSDTSPSRVQWEDDSVDDLDAACYEDYSDDAGAADWYDDEYTDDDSIYSDEDEEDTDAQLGATAAGPVKVIYSRPRPV